MLVILRNECHSTFLEAFYDPIAVLQEIHDKLELRRGWTITASDTSEIKRQENISLGF